MKKIKSKKGISLLTLVITIIILTILTSVVIVSLNNSSLIEEAKNATTGFNRSEIKTLIMLAQGEAALKNSGTVTYENLVEELTKKFGEKGVGYTISPDEPGNGQWDVTVKGVTEHIKGVGINGISITIYLDQDSSLETSYSEDKKLNFTIEPGTTWDQWFSSFEGAFCYNEGVDDWCTDGAGLASYALNDWAIGRGNENGEMTFQDNWSTTVYADFRDAHGNLVKVTSEIERGTYYLNTGY